MSPSLARLVPEPGSRVRGTGLVAAALVLWAAPALALEVAALAPGSLPPVHSTWHRGSPPAVPDTVPRVVRGDEIVVTSTRTDRRLQDEPLRIEVLDREEIEEKLLMSPGNIVMLLNETAGLQVQTTSPSLGAANIRIQGMRGRYTQLLADGLPLYGTQAGTVGLLQIPPADLGQVEIIKGTASALYGPSAMGGVVNLISRRPVQAGETEFLINATSRNGYDGVLYHSGFLTQGWSYSLVTSAHRQTRQDVDGSAWSDIPFHRRWTLRPRVFWDGPEGRSLFLTFGGMTEERQGGTAAGEPHPVAGDFTEALESVRTDLGATARWPVADLGFLKVRASWADMDKRHEPGGLPERHRNRTSFLEGALTGDAGRHTWVLGTALQRDAYRSTTHPEFDFTHTVPALFAQNETRLTRDLIASASIRLDHHSEYGARVSPRISTLYRPGPWTLRASAGTGFFAPTPFVEEIEGGGLAFLAPLENLRAEGARNASVDVGRMLGNLEANVSLFGSRVRNPVQLVPAEGVGPDGGPGVRLENAEGELRTAGAELLLRYRWSDFSLTGSYVLLEATEPDPEIGLRRDVPLTPRHTAGLVGIWEDHDRGLLGIEAYYTGRQPLDDNPYRESGRPWLHLGILAELRLGLARIFLNAENLLDVRQTDHDPLVRPQRARDGRWTVDAWAPLEGFVLNGGVRIRAGGGR